MIHNRSYMTEPKWRNGNVSVVTVLLIVNVAFFFIEGLAILFTGGPKASPVPEFVNTWLSLSVAGLGHGYLWQLVTYQFLHADLLHIALNMLGLWFLGRFMEHTVGPRTVLKLYLLSGVAGGLLQLPLMWALPKFFGVFVVGASAATSGLLAAFAMIEPQRVLTMMPLPFSFRAITIFWVSLIMALLGMVTVGERVAHAAHLGGLLFGAAYIKWIWPSEWSMGNWLERLKPAKRPVPQIVRVSKAKPMPPPSTDEMTPDYIAREVDPILDKISAHGIQSLTDREKKILEAARSKMAKK